MREGLNPNKGQMGCGNGVGCIVGRFRQVSITPTSRWLPWLGAVKGELEGVLKEREL